LLACSFSFSMAAKHLATINWLAGTVRSLLDRVALLEANQIYAKSEDFALSTGYLSNNLELPTTVELNKHALTFVPAGYNQPDVLRPKQCFDLGEGLRERQTILLLQLLGCPEDGSAECTGNQFKSEVPDENLHVEDSLNGSNCNSSACITNSLESRRVASCGSSDAITSSAALDATGSRTLRLFSKFPVKESDQQSSISTADRPSDSRVLVASVQARSRHTFGRSAGDTSSLINKSAETCVATSPHDEAVSVRSESTVCEQGPLADETVEEPKFPPSPYQLYVLAKRPTMSGPVGEIAKKLTTSWARLGANDRKSYEDAAREGKRKYEEDLAKYRNSAHYRNQMAKVRAREV